MKILYLKLRNFIGIYNGMKKVEIELDFSKSNDKFILLIGKNGSGKSTILNALHPFSSNIEEKPTFIRPGKDGYKEIHIYNGKNIYLIKHYYKASKTGHNTKSYITEVTENSEVELNPNGNVESFLNMVSIHLNVDFGFLKLTSLGKDIINFIDFKAAERKKYIGYMLQDINAYEKYHKRVGDATRKYQSIIKSISSKIDSINNKEHIESSLLFIENSLEEKNELKENILTNIGYIKSIIEDTSDIDSIICNINKFDSNNNELNELRGIVGEPKPKDPIEYETKIVALQDELICLKSNYDLLEQRILEFYETKESLEYHISDNKFKLDSSEKNEDIQSLNKLKKEYLDKLKDFDKEFKNKEVILNKEELLSIESFLDSLSKNIDTLQSNYTSSVLDECRNIGEINVNKECRKTREKMDRKTNILLDQEVELKTMIHNKNKYDSIVEIRPKECKIDSCSFIKDVIKYKNLDILILNKNDEIESTKNEISELVSKYEFYSACVMACNDLKPILNSIDAYKSLIDRVLFLREILNRDNIIKSIISNSINFSEIRSKIYALYSIVEDFEEYRLIKNEKLPKLESLILTNKLHSDDIKREINKAKTELKNINIKINKYKSDKDIVSEKIQKVEKKLLKNKEIYSNICRYLSLVQEQRILQNEYKKYHNKIDILQDTAKKVKEINKSLSLITEEINGLTKRRDSLIHQKRTLKDLKEEKELISNDYKDALAIRDAVSNTKGIPLLFINIYLEETKNIANRLLDLAFDGEFYIDDFVINESEFRIPCVGRGDINEDVQTASGGERIMTSLAMSFALIQQSDYKYNIILLDEMDGELDTENRKLFLHILEKQGSVINADQIFVITHNNEFDSIPAGLILLNGHNVDNYTNKNVIFQY